tara:strand:+ start:152 stop:781 length:630 start_codon:yes stop_codon:yes gene_type:complete
MKNIFDRIDKIKLTTIILFILIMSLITCSGCIGGKKVNANSTGVNISPSRLVQQPNGIFRLEPVEIQHPKSKPVKIDPVRSQPVSPTPTSAEPTKIEPKVNPIPAGELPKDPPKIVIPQLSTITNQTGELPIIIDNSGNEYNLTPAKKDKMRINWMELTEFYLWAMLFLSIMYLGWKAARKKTENMIKEEREKKAPKKAPKKKVTRKRK